MGAEFSVDRDEIILAVHLDAMAGIEEQGKVCVVELLDELAHGLAHVPQAQVETCDDIESEVRQLVRHALGIIVGVLQLRDIRVAGIPNYESYPSFGMCRACGKYK
ncbi:hypothetical protein LAL4801_06200 [Roseibium aggregatum]|uniref:Uncharacterized protein n=1 Tax=Roseibium aggregatum TaxID=187304 RepID=A0A0M6YFE5_9HYPH|nr:hypothetical protein LAL4801_06200 [Roseibium aggregatum]